MTMQNEIVKAPTTGERLQAQAVITERFRLFALQVSLEMTAMDATKILTWLDSQEFAETCLRAGCDADVVAGSFHHLIEKGNRNNVQFAI